MFKNNTTRIVALVITIAAIASLAVYLLSVRTGGTLNQAGKISVVGSFYPLSNAASIVGGNLVTVRNLVPSGVEPHDFDPSSRDFVDIGTADLLIYNGAGLEPWVQKWQSSSTMRPKNTIDMAAALQEKGTNLITTNGVVDPHFWVDPVMMKKEVEIIRDALITIDPAHGETYTVNAQQFSDNLDKLDAEFHSGLSSCSLKNIIVGHEAFDYLGREYGLSVTSVSGISPDEEPAPQDLTRIISLAKEKGVKFIFFETVASPKFSELVAREIGGGTLALNPLESLTPDEVQSGEDYVSIMNANLSNLKIALSCN